MLSRNNLVIVVVMFSGLNWGRAMEIITPTMHGCQMSEIYFRLEVYPFYRKIGEDESLENLKAKLYIG